MSNYILIRGVLTDVDKIRRLGLKRFDIVNGMHGFNLKIRTNGKGLFSKEGKENKVLKRTIRLDTTTYEYAVERATEIYNKIYGITIEDV